MNDGKKVNEKLKEFSYEELCAEIGERSNISIIASDKTISLKGGSNLLQLMGLAEKAKLEIFSILKQAELKKAAGGLIIPNRNVPPNLRGN